MSANFSNTLPAALTGGTNVLWQSDSNGNVSAYLPTSTGGAAAIVAKSILTAQAAAITATTLYAIPAGLGGLYRITYEASITTVDGTSCVLGGANGFQIKFTNSSDSVVKTSNPTTPNTSSVNATGTTISGTVSGYALQSTNLQFLMGYTGVGGQMRFDLAVFAEYLGA
jgi:hypothetical protein